MTAKDNLRTIHIVDGAMLTNNYGPARITRRDLGLLRLPTGEIVIGDPTNRYRMEDFKRKALSMTVAPGIYPMELYIAESEHGRVVAFAELRFNDNEPVKFVEAKTVFDADNNRKGFCGYVVNESQTGFMDAEVFRTINSMPKHIRADSVIDFDGLEDDETFEDNLQCVVGSSEDGKLTATLIHVNSGVYYWYWGKDRNGETCCLTADFFSFV